jgi:hypothetical protein
MNPQQTAQEATIETLVQSYFDDSPWVKAVYQIPSSEANAPIRLLIVDEASLAVGRINGFGFAPSKSVPLPMVIAVISPTELDILAEQGLPPEWRLEHAKRFLRAAA